MRFHLLSTRQSKRKRAFTLIEVLLSVGIIAVIAGITIQAIAPRKNILSATDSARIQRARQIERGLYQHLIATGLYPNDDAIGEGISSIKPICSQGTANGTDDCISLDSLVEDYIAAIPQDSVEPCPALSGFKVYKDSNRPMVVPTHLGKLTGDSGIEWGCAGGEGSGEGSVASCTWSTPVAIDSGDPLNSALRPFVAVNATGDAVAAWEEQDGIYANSFTNGSWGTAEAIDDVGGTGAAETQVAIDSSGNASAVWQESDGVRNNIYANRYTGGSWGTAEEIDFADAGHAVSPRIAMNAAGDAVATWTENDGTRNNVYANVLIGGSWRDAREIDFADAGPAGYSEIAINPSGDAVAVWQESNGLQNHVYANRFSGGSWQGAEEIDVPSGGNAYYPKVALDTSGNAIVLWTQSQTVYANRFSGGSWQGPEAIDAGGEGDANEIAIAVDSSGNAMAVFQHFSGGDAHIYANRYANGSWGGVEQIDAGNSNIYASEPSIAFDSSGNAIVAWQEAVPESSTYVNIVANRYAGGSWGTAEEVDSGNDGSAITPHVVMGSWSRILVFAYETAAEARYDIHARLCIGG